MSNEKNICPKCGTETTMFYCPECGEIIEYSFFVDANEGRKDFLKEFVGDNAGRKNYLQEFVREVITFAKQKEIDVKSAIDGSTVRNAIYRNYYERITYLQELCSYETTKHYFEHNGTNLLTETKEFAKKCEEGICQIAVVGTVKAGKSSFINALIGRIIASSYPTPETASVTKFRKSEKGDYVKVSFYTTNEWQELWDSAIENTVNIKRKEGEDKGFLELYNELSAEQIRAKYLDKKDETIYVNSLNELKSNVDKFTSARYAEHFFAKEVEVGLSDFFAPSNVVIVDSPGLDDPVPYRSNITRGYLPKADIVLVCLRSNRPELSATELKQLSYIFQTISNQNGKLIIGTQIDEQRDMLNFWEHQTLPEYLKYLSSETFYGSKEKAKKHIFPLSAFYYFDIKKCIDNPSVWQSKTRDDVELKKRIKEIVQRYYDCPEWQELVDEYGEDEAKKRYRSIKDIFEEHKYELLEMTQVERIRNMISEKFIRNVNKTIMTSIMSLFERLNSKKIKTTANEIIVSQRDLIEKAIESNEKKLEMDTLSKQIEEEKGYYDKLKTFIDDNMVKDLNYVSDKLLNELKK